METQKSDFFGKVTKTAAKKACKESLNFKKRSSVENNAAGAEGC